MYEEGGSCQSFISSALPSGTVLGIHLWFAGVQPQRNTRTIDPSGDISPANVDSVRSGEQGAWQSTKGPSDPAITHRWPWQLRIAENTKSHQEQAQLSGGIQEHAASALTSSIDVRSGESCILVSLARKSNAHLPNSPKARAVFLNFIHSIITAEGLFCFHLLMPVVNCSLLHCLLL